MNLTYKLINKDEAEGCIILDYGFEISKTPHIRVRHHTLLNCVSVRDYDTERPLPIIDVELIREIYNDIL